jgi:hypothetical protein
MLSIFQPTYVHFGSLSMPGAILSFQRFASFLLLLRRGVYVFTITRQRLSSRPQGIARVRGSDPTSRQLANLCRNGRSSWQNARVLKYIVKEVVRGQAIATATSPGKEEGLCHTTDVVR